VESAEKCRSPGIGSGESPATQLVRLFERRIGHDQDKDKAKHEEDFHRERKIYQEPRISMISQKRG